MPTGELAKTCLVNWESGFGDGDRSESPTPRTRCVRERWKKGKARDLYFFPAATARAGSPCRDRRARCRWSEFPVAGKMYSAVVRD